VERGEYDFRFQAQTRVGASPEEAVTLFGASVEQVDDRLGSQVILEQVLGGALHM